MRHVVVEHARARNAGEARGGNCKRFISTKRKKRDGKSGSRIWWSLDEILQNFASAYPRESEVVELKFFGGLKADEIAAAWHVSIKTVSRDWTFAKLWLCNEVTGKKPPGLTSVQSDSPNWSKSPSNMALKAGLRSLMKLVDSIPRCGQKSKPC